MTVNKHLRMGSDHYLLEVHIPVSCISKAIPIHTTQKRFDWTENNKQKYREISRGDLCEWALRHKFLDCEAEMLKKDAPSRIESATNKLVDIMITHFDKSAGARRTTTGHSLGNRITTDTKAATLARKRNEAQNNLEQAQWDLLPDEQVDHLQLIYTDSTRTLRDHFYQRELNAALDQKQSMEQSFVTDKQVLFHTLKNRLHPRSNALPTSLTHDGKELRDPTAIKEAWKVRCEIQPNLSSDPSNVLFRAYIENEVRTMGETKDADLPSPSASVILDLHVLKEAMKKSKTHKATGEDDVLNEMILHGPPELWEAIILLFRGMKNAERIAPRWKHTPLGPIYKMKGSRHDVVNYRPLGITSNLYKLYERCCAINMRRNLRNNPNQTGFRPGFSIHNLLMRLEAVIKLCEAENTDLVIVGIDFKEAYERAWRPGILYQLWHAGITGKLWRIIRDMLTDTTSCVRTNFGDTRTFRTRVGIIQGSVLAASLFAVYISPISDELASLSSAFNSILFPPQLYADDMAWRPWLAGSSRQSNCRELPYNGPANGAQKSG